MPIATTAGRRRCERRILASARVHSAVLELVPINDALPKQRAIYDGGDNPTDAVLEPILGVPAGDFQGMIERSLVVRIPEIVGSFGRYDDRSCRDHDLLQEGRISARELSCQPIQ